jgi:Zn-dependent M28 family amino/carboxypeptidase
MKRHFVTALFCCSLLSACQPNKAENTPIIAEQNPSNTVVSFEDAYSGLSGNTIIEHAKILASDDFGGRLPATEGEVKTLAYLTEQFTQAGLVPTKGDSFLQPVELISITASPNATLSIGQQNFNYKENMVVGSQREQAQIDITDSEVVFVGYGVNAPEYNWNDYEGLDVTGKTVIILVNDPGFENPDAGVFEGKTMTYYGRWSYKYEEASRQGAAAAIIVHETEPASYGWSVVANSWSGPQYGLVNPDKGASRVAIEGWISIEAARAVFAEAGKDFTNEKAKALQGPYHSALALTASASVQNTFETSMSYNFLATLPGSELPDEHIIFTAHWDHLGTDTSLEGDQIYNGFHDNATGTAGLITIAQQLGTLTERPKRSMTFLIVTAEEQGLLGSKYYANNPVVALDKTVANINIDAMNILGQTKDVAVVGQGKSELEQYLVTAATKQGRVVVQEPRPEAGYYYRSDHFSFAKAGVPALYAYGGATPLNDEVAAYRKKMNVIQRGCYHQVCDQYRDSINPAGMEEDARMLMDVAIQVANAEIWPQWSETSEFQRK